ncbi:hypothetical protein ON010_g13284 [Phytophthora cinnamomi]|nr:hypothetical protein ON010_g13284 [Phytophthora cinnamomi]
MTDQASRELHRRLLRELPASEDANKLITIAVSILDQIPVRRITLPVLSEFLNRQVIRPTGTRAAPAPAPASPPSMPTRGPPAPMHRSAVDNARPRVFPASAGGEYPYSALLAQRFVEGELEVQVLWEPTWESVRSFDREDVAAMQRELRNRRCARRL